MSPANLTLRFPLELALLAALAIWGAHAGAAGVLSAILAVVAPLAAAVPWGTLASPKPRVSVGGKPVGGELALFGIAIAGLAVAGFPNMAVALAIAVAFHRAWRAAETRRPAR